MYDISDNPLYDHVYLGVVPVGDPGHDDGLQVPHHLAPVLRLLGGGARHQAGQVAGGHLDTTIILQRRPVKFVAILLVSNSVGGLLTVAVEQSN